jgi:hypothetical protein
LLKNGKIKSDARATIKKTKNKRLRQLTSDIKQDRIFPAIFLIEKEIKRNGARKKIKPKLKVKPLTRSSCRLWKIPQSMGVIGTK